MKTVPETETNASLVGVTSNNIAQVVKVIYDEENKKISSNDLLTLPSTENEIINDIYDIYPKNQNDFFIQCFNFSKSQYELKYAKYNASSSEYEQINIPSAHSKSLFEINNYLGETNLIHFITSNQIEMIDIDNKSITGVIPLYEKQTNPIKITSDMSVVEPDTIAVGLNSDIFICDTKSQKITTQIQNAHKNAVLSLQYDPLNQLVICSTGTDYSIKFWDIRKTDTCLGGIYDNSHWIWTSKYNKNYPNVLLTASSSSIVRNIIFNKIGEEDNKFDKNLNDYSFIDYCEFEDSVYAVDWLANDSWMFVAVSYNSFFHVNTIPEEIKYKIII